MKIRSGSHSGTQLGSTLEIDSSVSTNTNLRYLKVCNLNTAGWGGTVKGTITDVQIWNGTNSTSGVPTYTISFSGLTAKPYMMVLGHGINSGAVRQS